MSDPATPPVEEILDVHRAGIAAIAEITSRYDAHQWQISTPCDEWTAVDLAGHVITAATMWHEALDDASHGYRDTSLALVRHVPPQHRVPRRAA